MTEADSKPGDWTRDELEATVEAYLQMLRLEQEGTIPNKSAVRRMLLAGRVRQRTTTEQRMQNVSHVLELMGRPRIAGYAPLPNVGAKTEKLLEEIIRSMTDADAVPLPKLPPPEPAATGRTRAAPATGYWMFLGNRKRWDGEKWLRLGGDHLLYKVSDHHRYEVQPGDLAVIRLNGVDRAGLAARAPGIWAVVEVTGPPALIADHDSSAYRHPSEAAEIAWRAPIRILKNLVDMPIYFDGLPEEPDFADIRRPYLASTIPLSRRAFGEIFRQAGLNGREVEEDRKAQSDAGVAALERAADADPRRREYISSRIERGAVGDRIKRERGWRCQLCSALGRDPIAFMRADGQPYAEAHHVQPVSLLLPGSLGAHNIMVLCPNHHREVHYGDFEILEWLPDAWRVRLGSGEHRIDRPA